MLVWYRSFLHFRKTLNPTLGYGILVKYGIVWVYLQM